MKHLLIILLAFFALAAHAQPVLYYATHGLAQAANDTVQEVAYAAPGPAGASQRWSFNQLPPVGTPVSTVSTVHWTGSVSLREADESDFHFLPVGNANLYTGFASAHKRVEYEKPLAKLAFPFAFGDSLSEAYTASGLFVRDSLASHIAGRHSVTADAYGTLVLPNGKVLDNTLRVKTIDSYDEQLCQSTRVATEKYQWYVPYYAYPVFTTVQTIYGYAHEAARDTLQGSYYTLCNLSQHEAAFSANRSNNSSEEPEITLFPNPASSYTEIVAASVALQQYQIWNTQGALYKSGKISKQEMPIHIDLHGMGPGWYVMKLETPTGWVIKRFIKQ